MRNAHSTSLKLLVASLAIAVAGCATTDDAASGRRLEFVTHAAFFSSESGRPIAIDPQVFVVLPGAPAATGPEDIAHAADLRNAMPSDALAIRLFSATGKSLDMTVGQWFFASGSVTLKARAEGGPQLVVQLKGLRPAGAYSLFEAHLDQQPVGYTPLDGIGIANSFVADESGTATITVIATRILTHDTAVLLVYHSDGEAHGQSRGAPGIDAHHQLIVRLP